MIFSSLKKLAILWLNNNKLDRIKRKCFAGFNNYITITLFENVRKFISFEKNKEGGFEKFLSQFSDDDARKNNFYYLLI